MAPPPADIERYRVSYERLSKKAQKEVCKKFRPWNRLKFDVYTILPMEIEEVDDLEEYNVYKHKMVGFRKLMSISWNF